MANEMGEVPVIIGGYEKKLRYNFAAIDRLETLRGMSISALFDEAHIAKTIGIGFIADALLAGLSWGNKHLRREEVLAMMKPEEFEGYLKAIAAGIAVAMGRAPLGEGEQTANPPPAPPSTAP